MTGADTAAPRGVVLAVLLCMALGGVLRGWGLRGRGLWEVDEATYTLGARAYVHLHEARAAARRAGADLHDRDGMRAIMRDVFPMDYDFRYQFTRGPAREDVLMSGFRTWGKPTFCAAVVLATFLLGPTSTLPGLAVAAVAGTLLIGAVGWAAWRLTSGAWAAAGAAAWAATSLAMVHYSRTAYGATLWTLCFCAILLLAIPAWRMERVSHVGTGARGVLAGTLVSIFYGLLPLVALLALTEAWWLVRLRRAGEPVARHAGVWLAAFVAPLAAWQIAGLWRAAYLGGELGFANVHAYLAEVLDQLGSEVELPAQGIGSTIAFWTGNTLGLEGALACGFALAGTVVLLRRARGGDSSAVSILLVAGVWLGACTLGRMHFGRIYTPLLPVFGLAVGCAVQLAADKNRHAAAALVAALVLYGAWNVRPLLTVRSGLPDAAKWIQANADPGRVAVCTFGYNQLFRAHLNRTVHNPPTSAVLQDVADVYVDVGPLASRFTERTLDVTPLAAFPDPVLHYAAGRIDLGVKLSPWWRFRLTAHDWQRLRGAHPNPAPTDLVRIYGVDMLL